MLTAARSLRQNIAGAPELPRIPQLHDLYNGYFRFRFCENQLLMIAGRSGSGKSTLALFLAAEWGMLGKKVLYFSADMSAHDTSVKLASAHLNMTEDEIHHHIEVGGDESREIFERLGEMEVSLSNGPITWDGMEEELDAFIELWNAYPDVIVVDNLMDIENCESDYSAQQEAMQFLTNLKTTTGACVIVLHHATDKDGDASSSPFNPPPRKAIKNGMSEKPDAILTVALTPRTNEFKIGTVKNRRGGCDQSAQMYTTIIAEPERNRYHRVMPVATHSALTRGEDEDD